jgi:hypothetical protein
VCYVDTVDGRALESSKVGQLQWHAVHTYLFKIGLLVCITLTSNSERGIDRLSDAHSFLMGLTA